ncbi:MAG: hypothetical protein IBJ12_10670 [Sphingomonadaceae bacterium]|nr:hypothetical protein [Sphingomonadaceae bacterium]
MSFLLQGLDTLERYKRNLGIKIGILVISAIIKKDQKEALKTRYPSTIIYDLNTLSFLAADSEALSSKFEEFTREILAFSPALEITPEAPSLDVEDASAAPETTLAKEVPKDGERLCNELKKTPTGKIGWRKFEKSCVDALRYIFQEDLTGWNEQRRTESGISIYDTVCRIVSNHDLWRMFIHQFNSRYVIFEYKNYTYKVKQGQIYTTEKYLYKPALRSVAFIISRKGPDENANAACRGALREHGKLIVNLTVDDLCEMLQAKDLEDDPNSILMAKIDDMLTTLDR